MIGLNSDDEARLGGGAILFIVGLTTQADKL